MEGPCALEEEEAEDEDEEEGAERAEAEAGSLAGHGAARQGRLARTRLCCPSSFCVRTRRETHKEKNHDVDEDDDDGI